MTCIYTGARVYLPDYGLFAPADIFEVGNTIIARFPRDPSADGDYIAAAPENTTHTIRLNPPGACEVWFERGMVIVDPRLVTHHRRAR